MSRAINTLLLSLAVLCPLVASPAAAQGQPAPATRPATQGQAAPATRPTQGQPAPATRPAVTGPQVQVPSDYVIGPEDVVGVLFWREPEMTVDAMVRPDGMITVPLLGDIPVNGLKPDALAVKLQQLAGEKVLTDPVATVVIRQVNSRKVYVNGEVRTPNAYPLVGPRDVMQMLAMAGGLTEYADGEKITILRKERGTTRSLKFNYKEVAKGKRLEQNIELQPGDTILVP
jgi:polysaccharide export outer membrane protein